MTQMLLFPDPRPLVERLGRDFLRQVPERPGDYLMRDAGDAVLYVGKARNLRKRLGAYRVANPDRMPQQFHTMRKASLGDVEQLVTMMAEFYSDSPYTLNRRRATEAFTSLLADERRGHVWFIEANSKDVGYVVVTLCHSMTYGGLSAIVDDFFIQRAFRGAGLGKAAMAEVRSFCASHGIRAIHVETGRDNAPALAVYRRAGFVDTDLVHLTLGLAEPTHAP